MTPKRIITYNLNGIRSATSKGFIDWLRNCGSDVVCLQETKAQPDQIPVLEIAEAGYSTYCLSAQKKGYSGVALLCRQEPDHVEKGMGIPAYDNEGRFIRADFGQLSIVSVYHPSGTSGDERQSFKMQWLEDFQSYVENLRKTRPYLVLAGDYNICHEAIDIHDPVRNATHSGFLPEEREWMSGGSTSRLSITRLSNYYGHTYGELARPFSSETVIENVVPFLVVNKWFKVFYIDAKQTLPYGAVTSLKDYLIVGARVKPQQVEEHFKKLSSSNMFEIISLKEIIV